MFHFSNPLVRDSHRMKLSIVLWELCYKRILSLLQEKVFTETPQYIVTLATILARIDEAIDIKSISDPDRDLSEIRTVMLLDISITSISMRNIIDDVLPSNGDEEENEEDLDEE